MLNIGANPWYLKEDAMGPKSVVEARVVDRRNNARDPLLDVNRYLKEKQSHDDRVDIRSLSDTKYYDQSKRNAAVASFQEQQRSKIPKLDEMTVDKSGEKEDERKSRKKKEKRKSKKRSRRHSSSSSSSDSSSSSFSDSDSSDSSSDSSDRKRRKHKSKSSSKRRKVSESQSSSTTAADQMLQRLREERLQREAEERQKLEAIQNPRAAPSSGHRGDYDRNRRGGSHASGDRRGGHQGDRGGHSRGASSGSGVRFRSDY
jgi:hypothetical protein